MPDPAPRGAPHPARHDRRRWYLLGSLAGILLLGTLAAGYAVATQGSSVASPSLSPAGLASASPSTAVPETAAPAASAAAATPSGSSVPGLSSGPPPWPAAAGLGSRLQAIGLPALTAEGEALHTHQHLDIVIDGQAVPVPAGIGIDAAAGFLSPIHTHDATGLIHVESPVVRDFTLGEFFDIWGVRFDAHCIGGECDGNGRSLEVFVNGGRVSGDPRAIALEPREEILVALGSAAQLPSPIPATYPFPEGL